MALKFEWDEDKASSNLKKHRVTFEEAASVFADPLAAIFDDEVHSEVREGALAPLTDVRVSSSW